MRLQLQVVWIIIIIIIGEQRWCEAAKQNEHCDDDSEPELVLC